MSERNKQFDKEGLTYDDVLLLPAYSEILPRNVNLNSRITKNITVNTPVVSAAMDTVTESKMAIAIAQQGGIGVVHKNMTIEHQALEVRKVKRSESGLILDPITLRVNARVNDALTIMANNKIGGIPVIDNENNLKGIVTNRDLRFEKDHTRLVQEVMTSENIVTTDEGTDLSKAAETLQKHKIEKLPVVDEHNKLVGLITYRDIIKVKEHPNSCKDEYGRLRVAAAIGVTEDAIERVDALKEAGVDAIFIDTAHGHTEGVIKTLKDIKSKYPDLDVSVGNVATADGARYLADAGADAIKVGIGPGSICTTRIIAGVGVPQLTAVSDVAEAIKGSGIPIIADGGIRFTGDIVKAIAAGADTVMIGSMFAGVEESPGDTILYEGRKFKTYRGMGSIESMSKGSKDRYFQDAEDDIKKLVPEGITGRVPYKGVLKEVVYQIFGGLRAGMGYTGAASIDQLQGKKMIRVTNSGIKESHPHDVAVTREAPNYSLH